MTPLGTGTLTIAAVAILVSGTAPSEAAPRHKKVEVQVQASTTHRTTAPEKKEEEPLTRRPGLAAEQFRATTRTKMGKLTSLARRKLEELLAMMPKTDPERPDVLFRLAEHCREEKVTNEFRARELDERIFASSDAALKARLRASQRRYEANARRWMIDAIRRYLEIYGEPAYRNFKRADEVLFNLAAMLNEANRRNKAREVFSRLVRNFPNSRYVPDALLSFAEHYFNQGQVLDALKLYERIGKYSSSPLFGYAVYKQGWCWLNLKNPRRALELFVKVIRNANRWTGSKKGRVVLTREAKKDAVRAYSQVGTPSKAWAFFSRIGGSYAPRMLERLARIYYDQGKFVASVRIYKQLAGLDPKSKSLCGWQYAILKATLPSKDRRKIVVEAKRLAAVYELLLQRRRTLRRTALTECRANAAGVLRELATTWHREAQTTMDRDTYAMARYLYKEYLDRFPKQKDAYKLSFYHAELLFKLEKWDQAARAYRRVITMRPRGKYHKEAAWAEVIARRNAVNEDEAVRTARIRHAHMKLEPLPISPKQQKMIAAIDTYLRVVPQAKERVPLMYRKARIYYENNHFEKAVDGFASIVTKHPGHELAVYAANLLLDSLNVLERFDEIGRWIDRMEREPKLARGDFLTTLQELKINLGWREAEKHRLAGRYRNCGDVLTSIANQYPNSSKWQELVYNAAICFEAAKLIGLAISARSTLVKTAPDHPLAQKSLYMIGANYHALAWYSRAAESYETFARRFPGEPEAPKALQNAIVFRLGRAEYDKAIDDARLYAKSYGRRHAARTASVIFSLGQIHEQRKDRDAVARHYKMYLRDWGSRGGIDRRILAHVRIGEALWRSACPTKTVHGACISVERQRSRRKIKRSGKKRVGSTHQCGPESKSRVTVRPRHPLKARIAMRHFDEALALFRRAGKLNGGGSSKEELARRTQQMRFAAASARFYQAEQAFEAFLAVAFPTGLDFSNPRRRPRSQRVFSKYLARKGDALMRARKLYQDVIGFRVAHWAIAGAARVGQLYQHFSDALYTAPVPQPPVPKVLRSKKQREEFRRLFVDNYCDALEDRAAPLEERAIQGFAICVNKATELSWYNSWSGLCEAELNQIRPTLYPLASEIRARPGYVNVAADRAGVIARLK